MNSYSLSIPLNSTSIEFVLCQYDLIVSYFVLVFLSALVDIWHVPYAQQITLTLAALDTLIGTLTVILKKNYDKNHVLTEIDLDEIPDKEE